MITWLDIGVAIVTDIAKDHLQQQLKRETRDLYKQLYLKSFGDALENLKPSLEQHSETIEIDWKVLKTIIGSPHPFSGEHDFNSITDPGYVNNLATQLYSNNALILGGYSLSDTPNVYESWVRTASETFHVLIRENDKLRSELHFETSQQSNIGVTELNQKSDIMLDQLTAMLSILNLQESASPVASNKPSTDHGGESNELVEIPKALTSLMTRNQIEDEKTKQAIARTYQKITEQKHGDEFVGWGEILERSEIFVNRELSIPLKALSLVEEIRLQSHLDKDRPFNILANFFDLPSQEFRSALYELKQIGIAQENFYGRGYRSISLADSAFATFVATKTWKEYSKERIFDELIATADISPAHVHIRNMILLRLRWIGDEKIGKYAAGRILFDSENSFVLDNEENWSL